MLEALDMAVSSFFSAAGTDILPVLRPVPLTGQCILFPVVAHFGQRMIAVYFQKGFSAC